MPDPLRPAPARRAPSAPARAAAAGLALLGAAASFLLVLGHWRHLDLPGCGADSPCARAAASPWALVPLIPAEVPVASVALAYFLAWLALLARGPIPRSAPLRWGARLALAAAALYLAAAVSTRLLCPYCLLTHAAVLGLWALAEFAHAGRSSARLQAPLAAALAVASLTATGLWTSIEHHRRDQRELDDQLRLKNALSQPAAKSPLEGRYTLGRPDAPVRLVVFTGYQCPDCRALEDALAPLLAANPDVSLSVRHFPFCADCNRLVTRTIHPNACWAARAAETAGLLRGPDGFWAMHRWLFSRGGAFTDAELTRHLADEGFDPRAFLGLMQSEQPLALVTQDVELAASLALNRTPTLFVNAVEIRNWNSPPGALADAIAFARRTPASPTANLAQPVPPAGADRLLAEWRDQPVTPAAADQVPHSLGPADAPVRITVFGDYQDDGTVKLDERLRALTAADPRLRYTYRHYPADQKCNPSMPRSFHPLACRLARTAEGAAAVAGEDAFWSVHAFILGHHRAYSDAELRAFCESSNLGAAAILKARDDPAMTDALADDVAAGTAAGVTELPWLLVNDRRVPRWTLDDGDILERLIDEAAKR